MKSKLRFLQFVFLCSALYACGQGTFQYDQQSGGTIIGQGFSFADQPMGQSFTPTLSSVGFVRFVLGSGQSSNDVLYVNLRADSIAGPILGASDPFVGPVGNFLGPVDFIFSTPVAVTPGTSYFFQPVMQTGAPWAVLFSTVNYPGGTSYRFGDAQISDLWFQEGVIVPEPSSWALLILGLGLIAVRKRY